MERHAHVGREDAVGVGKVLWAVARRRAGASRSSTAKRAPPGAVRRVSRVDLCASVDVDDAADRVAEGGGVPAGRRALPHRSLLASREAEELADRRQLVEHLKMKIGGKS